MILRGNSGSLGAPWDVPRGFRGVPGVPGRFLGVPGRSSGASEDPWGSLEVSWGFLGSQGVPVVCFGGPESSLGVHVSGTDRLVV